MVAFTSIDVLGASARSVCQHLTHLVTTPTAGSVDPQVFTYPQRCGFFIVTNSFMNRAEHLGPVFIVIRHSVDIRLHGSLFSLSFRHLTNSPFCPPLTLQVCRAEPKPWRPKAQGSGLKFGKPRLSKAEPKPRLSG